jgi:hypothetical protein
MFTKALDMKAKYENNLNIYQQMNEKENVACGHTHTYTQCNIIQSWKIPYVITKMNREDIILSEIVTEE